MSKAEQANEPTMEEILASIRRIISDDDQESGAAAAAAGADGEDEAEVGAAESEMTIAEEEGATMAGSPAEAEMEVETVQDEPEVLELTDEVGEEISEEEMSGDEPEAASGEEAETAESEADIVFLEKTEDEMDAEFAEENVKAEPAEEPAPAASLSGHLLSSKADSSVASAFSSLENFVLSTHSRTLEDLVQEMLKPMLKEWLDANSPPLVERMVREEIERVSRGRR